VFRCATIVFIILNFVPVYGGVYLFISLTASNGGAIGFDRFLFFFYSILLKKSCQGHNSNPFGVETFSLNTMSFSIVFNPKTLLVSVPFLSWHFIFGHSVVLSGPFTRDEENQLEGFDLQPRTHGADEIIPHASLAVLAMQPQALLYNLHVITIQ